MKTTLLAILATLLPSCEAIKNTPVNVAYVGDWGSVGYSTTSGLGIIVKKSAK